MSDDLTQRAEAEARELEEKITEVAYIFMAPTAVCDGRYSHPPQWWKDQSHEAIKAAILRHLKRERELGKQLCDAESEVEKCVGYKASPDMSDCDEISHEEQIEELESDKEKLEEEITALTKRIDDLEIENAGYKYACQTLRLGMGLDNEKTDLAECLDVFKVKGLKERIAELRAYQTGASVSILRKRVEELERERDMHRNAELVWEKTLASLTGGKFDLPGGMETVIKELQAKVEKAKEAFKQIKGDEIHALDYNNECVRGCHDESDYPCLISFVSEVLEDLEGKEG